MIGTAASLAPLRRISASVASAASHRRGLICRTFYMGGDAHLYLPAPIQSDYIFDRPPVQGETTMAAHSSTADAAGAAAMQQYYHSLNPSPLAAQSAAAGSAASSGVAVATAGGAGGAWLAYESAEFTPWEDILLDLTAWMIAICLSYDPSRSKETEEEEDKRKNTTDGKKRRRQQHERLAAAQEHNNNEKDCSKDQDEECQHHASDNERK